MNTPAFGFWAVVGAVIVRAAGVVPGLVAREPGAGLRLVVAAVVFVLVVASTPLTVRRVRAADPASAAAFIWAQGGAGLALAFVLLWLF